MSLVKQDQAVLNRVWCQLIFEELSRWGVEHVCLAPGSRSTPLTLEADQNQKLTLHTHFDERGLAFFALGIAKASKAPVAVIVTSGTAVANLLPAVVESGLTKEKLILLTADRPVELIDCGANQAISQLGIFSEHVTASLNLPSPTEQIAPQWLLTSLDQLMLKQRNEDGAIHINCPFPEPLYSDQPLSIYDNYLRQIQHWTISEASYCRYFSNNQVCDYVIEELDQRKGIVVIGQVELDDANAAKELAVRLGWPVFCDPQSGISSDWQHYDLWLQNAQANKALSECNFILQFGARLVSKRLTHFISAQAANFQCEYMLVSPLENRFNPDHLPQTQILAKPAIWAARQQVQLNNSKGHFFGWGDSIARFSQQITSIKDAYDGLSEIALASCLDEMVASYDLFIGNSLIVRLVDMVGRLSGNRVYTNRGASGIDGLIASASGVQAINQQPMLMLIGDTSLLYDLNSLSLCSKDVPLVIIVTNNDGGAIFDLLPVEQKKKIELYKMPHGYQFEHAALQFGLTYSRPNNLNELKWLTQRHLGSGKGSLLIEMSLPSDQASADIKSMLAAIHDLQ